MWNSISHDCGDVSYSDTSPHMSSIKPLKASSGPWMAKLGGITRLLVISHGLK